MKPARLYTLAEQPSSQPFEGVDLRHVTGARGTFATIALKQGARVPEHEHPHEQFSYVIQGRLAVETSPGGRFEVGPGQLLHVPPRVRHGVEALEESRHIEIFAPARLEFDPPGEVESAYTEEDRAHFAELGKFCPDFVQQVRSSDVWSRPVLAPREKELVVLSSLISQGGLEDELRQHVNTAQARGLEREEILEIIILLSAYVGVPRTLNALALLQRMWSA